MALRKCAMRIREKSVREYSQQSLQTTEYGRGAPGRASHVGLAQGRGRKPAGTGGTAPGNTEHITGK